VEWGLRLIQQGEWSAVALSVAGAKTSMYALDDAAKDRVFGQALGLGGLKVIYRSRTHDIAPDLSFESYIVH